MYIGSFYRPNSNHPSLNPNEQYEIFMELLANLLDGLNHNNVTAFLMGDFNLDLLKYGTCTKVTDYVDLLFSHGFIQTISKPTRCTDHSSTLIDHCITNSTSYSHNSNVLTTLVSDHFPILYQINHDKQQNAQKTIEYRDFSDENMTNFKKALKSISWEPLLNSTDTQLAYNIFEETFTSLYDIYFPLLTKKFNIKYHKNDPWFTSGLLVSRREKIRLDKKAAKSRSIRDFQIYKNYRNIYNKTVKKAKQLYFDSQFVKCQSNLKKTWQLLRQAINKKPKKSEQQISDLMINNKIENNPLKLAHYFNQFFSTAPQDIVNQINPTHIQYPDPVTPDPDPNHPLFQSADLQIGDEEFLNAINSIEPKKSTDFNNISMFFLKKCLQEIIHPLKHIFNLSLTTGVIPKQLKIAKIVPIFKSGDPRNPDNYRPIALLSNFSKILEKIVHARLMSYLEAHNILSGSQFGFRANHSTVHPMVHLSNFISKSFQDKKLVLAVFCDLKKALDTVNHNILLKKLYKYGIRGRELEWFKNYLSDRKQYVVIKGLSSDMKDIIIGVPQGSVLGPLLFLIYINDLPESTNLAPFLFADDTTLLYADEDLERLFEIVNNELAKVSIYFRLNKLALHPKKQDI